MPKSKLINEEFKAIKSALEVLEPLREDQRRFAIDMITARLGLSAPSGKRGGGSGDVHCEGPPSPREFLKERNPVTDLERYVCLAFYLTRFRDMAAFTTREVTKLNDEAGGQNFSNAAATANNAVRQSKLLANAGHGKKRITLRGEELAEALPDRQKVATIITGKNRKKGARKPPKR